MLQKATTAINASAEPTINARYAISPVPMLLSLFEAALILFPAGRVSLIYINSTRFAVYPAHVNLQIPATSYERAREWTHWKYSIRRARLK
jgi:hypothetical protein